MTDELQHQPYRIGDEDAIRELFRASFGGRELPLADWYWRFRDNPSGPGLIELSWEAGRLAAHYAVTSMRMRIEGSDRLGALSGTTMTHPEHRGKGLFQLLARQTYDRMSQEGMSLVWGFPNSQSHRGFVRDLQWHDLCEMPTMRCVVSAERRPSAYSNAVVELEDTDERFDRLWIRVRDEHRVIGRRDAETLRWRYVRHPSVRYRLIAYSAGSEITGYVVFKRYADELQIVDFLVPKAERDVGEALVSSVYATAVAGGLSAVSAWMRVDQPLHHALEKCGFVPDAPVTYAGSLSFDRTLDTVLSDVRGWYFTMGDSDVY